MSRCIINAYMSEGISKQVFIEILEEAKSRLLSIKGLKKIKSGDEFEALLFSVIKEICAERKIRDVRRTGKQTFPDIVIWPFGVEAKTTVSDTWISTGNSIVETTRVPDLKEIFIFFLKQGKKTPTDIRFKSYEECLSDIVVTHSPRYKLDMNLEKNKNIFKKMGIDYETFSQSDSIKLAKEYYRRILRKGEELWWIDQQYDVGVTPIIKNFGDLEKKTQEAFKIEAIVLFPEIFSASNQKYVKASFYLLRKYQSTCSSFRDLFSAGGQETIKVGSRKTKIPKIHYNLYLNATKIKEQLSEADKDEVYRIWNLKLSSKSDIEKDWLKLLDKLSDLKHPKASEIYKAGLRLS